MNLNERLEKAYTTLQTLEIQPSVSNMNKLGFVLEVLKDAYEMLNKEIEKPELIVE